MNTQPKERLLIARKTLEETLTLSGLLEFNTKFQDKYERKYGTALEHCMANSTDRNALDKYINRECQVKARYFEMVSYQYNKQMRLL